MFYPDLKQIFQNTWLYLFQLLFLGRLILGYDTEDILGYDNKDCESNKQFVCNQGFKNKVILSFKFKYF